MRRDEFIRRFGYDPKRSSLATTAITGMRPSQDHTPMASAAVPRSVVAAPRQLTPEQQQLVAESALTAGLRDAVKRQIEKMRPGTTALLEARMNQHEIEQELCSDDSDSVQLGLAKACARLGIRQLGIERAAPLIRGVRDLKAGHRLGANRGSASAGAARTGHVIAVAPRR